MQRTFMLFSLAVLIGLAFVTTSFTRSINDMSKTTMYAQAQSQSDSDTRQDRSSDMQSPAEGQRGSDIQMNRESQPAAPGGQMDRPSDAQGRMSGMQGSDIFATLRQEHQQVKQMLSRLQSVSDPVERNELVKQLNVALYPHLKAEEKTLYKALKDNKDAKDMAKQAQKEHDQALKVLKDVNKSINDNTFAANVSRLEQLVSAHVQREESEVFAAARNLDQAKLSDIATKYQEEEQKLTQKTEEKDYGKKRTSGSERDTTTSGSRGDRTGTSSGNVPGGATGSGN